MYMFNRITLYSTIYTVNTILKINYVYIPTGIHVFFPEQRQAV